jgi:hypothetical protein
MLGSDIVASEVVLQNIALDDVLSESERNRWGRPLLSLAMLVA